jgi:hypothetical protein
MSVFGSNGFWRRVGAMILKEFVQLRRDRITFATIITIPLMQLDPQGAGEHQVFQGDASSPR